MKGLYTVSFVVGLMNSPVIAQHAFRSTIELGTFGGSADQTPFWLRSNQFGIVPYKRPVATLRLATTIDYDSLRLFTHRLTYGGGLGVVENAGVQGGVLLAEAYFKAKLGVFEVYGGRRREFFGLADSILSTGSYAWSGNALPIPKVQLEIRSYTPIGFTNGFLAIKGSFAHGWLGGRYVQHTLLHQKSLYLRLGKPTSRLTAFIGLNHQVVWGGESQDLLKTGLIKNAQLPSSFKDYLSIVSGLRSSNTGLVDTVAYTDFDLTNRVGNHLGSVDLALELKTTPFTYYLYRENPYETGALFYGTSLADGLNGFRIRSKDPTAILQTIVVEYLNTANQGGSEFQINDPKHRGRVNYFNHSQYRDGWSYQGLGIGTPFISPALGPGGALPYGGFTDNNRVHVWHIGLSGTLVPLAHRWFSRPIGFQLKASFSHNLGTYNDPFSKPKNQFSGVMSLLVPLSVWQGLDLSASLGIDQGTLYANTTGFYFSIRKAWSATIH